MTDLKKIPIGIEDFKEIIDKNCYFDKGFIIKRSEGILVYSSEKIRKDAQYEYAALLL